MKNNKLDSFESFINDKISGEEVAYNANDWNDLSSRLDAISPTPFYKKGWFIGGAAALVVGASTLLIHPQKEQPSKKEEVVVKEQPIQVELPENIVLENDFIAKKEVIAVANVKNTKLKTTNKNTKSETKTKEEINVETLTKTHHQSPQKESTFTSSFSQSNQENKMEYIENVTIPNPSADYTYFGELKGCPNLEVTFEAKNQKDVNYLWSFGDGIYSDLVKPTHIYTQPGTYQVELIVQSSLDQTILTKSEEKVTITVFELPKMDIIEDRYLEEGITTIDFSFIGDKVNELTWHLDDGNTAKTAEVKHQYKKKGQYKIELEAYSTDGCKSKSSKTIFIEKDYNLMAPTAFSPNGDGLNDLFLPEALKTTTTPFKMIIQSRTNGIVFESTSSDNQWDGKNYKTGLPCDEANYVWIVKLTNKEGIIEEYKGVVLITMTDK